MRPAVFFQSTTVNFQVTVLKVLVSYPGGFALLADLKRDVALLATSGPDWSERTKRLASRLPGIDIFSQGLVDRVDGGWRITDKGKVVLEVMETRPAPEASPAIMEQRLESQPNPLRIFSLTQSNQRRQVRRRQRRSAVLKAASPAREGLSS